MPKTRQEKEQHIADVVHGLGAAKAVVFANFQGLKVSESEELRRLCREQGISVVASKKTLLAKVFEQAGISASVDDFDGAVAVITGFEDEVAPAQTVVKFAKGHEAMRVFGGMLEGQFISMEKVAALSALPTKHELLGKLVGTINAPVSGFVNVLAGNIRGLLTVLNAVKEQRA